MTFLNFFSFLKVYFHKLGPLVDIRKINNIFSVNDFQQLKVSTNFRKLFTQQTFIFCLVNWNYVPRWIKQKCDFIFIFEFSSTFRNVIHFWPRTFSLNFRKFFILSIFIFCLVNCTYMPCKIEKICDFVNLFWIFLYAPELNSFLASKIFTKLRIYFYSINIYIMPCKLNLCATRYVYHEMSLFNPRFIKSLCDFR